MVSNVSRNFQREHRTHTLHPIGFRTAWFQCIGWSETFILLVLFDLSGFIGWKSVQFVSDWRVPLHVSWPRWPASERSLPCVPLCVLSLKSDTGKRTHFTLDSISKHMTQMEQATHSDLSRVQVGGVLLRVWKLEYDEDHRTNNKQLFRSHKFIWTGTEQNFERDGQMKLVFSDIDAPNEICLFPVSKDKKWLPRVSGPKVLKLSIPNKPPAVIQLLGAISKGGENRTVNFLW